MRLLVVVALLLCQARAFAAGAVVGEPGSCAIEVGVYTAHFTIYQPDTSGNREFCEDLPDTGSTLFVMDYLHGSLKDVPVDFRIIRDDDELGIFARWDNVREIADLDARTVYYAPPTIHPENSLTARVNFTAPGRYIGIVSAPHTTKDIHYHAVFPFQVGRINWGGWALLAAAMVAAAAYVARRLRHA